MVMSQAAIRSGWSVRVLPASSLSLSLCVTADGSPARLLSSPLCCAELSCAAETPPSPSAVAARSRSRPPSSRRRVKRGGGRRKRKKREEKSTHARTHARGQTRAAIPSAVSHSLGQQNRTNERSPRKLRAGPWYWEG